MNEMLLVELQMCPPIYVFVLAKKYGGLSLEAYENYQKKSFRNRLWVATPNGKDSFSVPLKSGKANKTPIREVQISYEEDWIRKLKYMMTTNYGGAAYFDFYMDEFMSIFEKKNQNLWETNFELLNWCINSAQMNLDIYTTESYQKEENVNSFDIRNKPLSFYRNITSKELPEYDQIFMEQVGFIVNLSIVDLIMNKGPEAGLLISQWANRLDH